MWSFVRALLIALTFSAFGPAGEAQEYPTRTVTILVPFAPGGGTDMLARVLAQKLEQRLGKPFVVENRAGAGTNIAAAALNKAPPDGHTLMQATSSTFATNLRIYKHLPYDPSEIAPVSLICTVPFVLMVHPSLPVHSVADLIRLAKEQRLSYASSGPGAFHHLNAELMSAMVGIKMTHVPYKGSAPALNDIVAGHIQLMFVDLAPSLELIRAGRLRALGVTTAERAAAAPEIPPLAEVGLPGYDAAAWQMLAAPAKTPRPILMKLNAEVNAIVSMADVKEHFVKLGLNPVGKGSLEELEAFRQREVDRWGKVVEQAGIAGSE
jgi:tripartite-type tricarboxylate transporter receptor subunit TctC